MPDQLNLWDSAPSDLPFDLDPVADPLRKLVGYTLFLALFPGPEDAQRIAAAELGRQHGLRARGVRPDRLHITLHAVALYRHGQPVSRAVVDAARAAAAGVTCPALPIVFDRVESFTESSAFVLRCVASSDAAIARLRQSLATALRHAGLHPTPSSTPHMTLLHDKRHVAECAIEPICWAATRFALVLSHVGLGHHQWVDQWPLADHS